jgi:aminoglycoside phosphotransferase (APT) family kinase protein
MTRAEALRRRGFEQYVIERYPGSWITDFVFVTSGWESDIYSFRLHFSAELVKSYILRPYNGEGAAQKLVRESRGLELLGEAGYPVPAALLSEGDGSILGKPFIVMEKLEGRVLWAALDGASSYEANDLLVEFGRLLAQLHQLDWRPFTEQAALYEANPAVILDELLASLRQLYTQYDLVGFLAVVDWLESYKTRIVVRPSVVHLDFHANNVFLGDDGRLAVIDWTQIGVSDYRTDVSWTLMIMGFFGQFQWAKWFLRAYKEIARHTDSGFPYFEVLSYTKLLASTVISLKESPEKLGMRGETAESIEGQLPVLKFLAQRLHDITGLTVPEVEAVFREIG